jgi:hypothetical protein
VEIFAILREHATVDNPEKAARPACRTEDVSHVRSHVVA